MTIGPAGAAVSGEAGEALVFGGSASRGLTEAICAELGGRPGRAELIRFSEGSIYLRVDENVRGRSVYVVQSTLFPANDQLVELLFWMDALKRASAASICAVVPYFSYAKGDRQEQPRTAIRARVCADVLQAAGAARVIALDLHSPQVQGFFSVPADELTALPILCRAIEEEGMAALTVVSPDSGFVKRARRFASRLAAPLAIVDKRRSDHAETPEILELIGHVEGRDAVLVDDFVISGRTLAGAAELARQRGARSVTAAVTHGVFAPAAREVIDSSVIRRLVVTDSVEGHPWPLPARLRVVSVAPLLAEALRRAERGESLAALAG